MTSGVDGIRCAIYTRKSTEEGLEQEFNSLMAQREAAEAYILSQRELGWRVVPQLYDDGGFSGGSPGREAWPYCGNGASGPERPFAHQFETGAGRRLHVRGRNNV